ncbi:MFS general substrate transporter [Eremomyces bilateralis CBS 781.70]|uniref:MFS general substrate transporter n=1 Tax=Eremomyces bilateralis CBS 781.70 TaxID=1392243 RepID=A0A6G1G4F5_9PEZI|nr:MFS general substrate transporter [Eremomyces bilateralis CBS 781.70]KAF1812975.1 MFS general substrate transporter [Eremomyces bilateralis CBS 781.70]
MFLTPQKRPRFHASQPQDQHFRHEVHPAPARVDDANSVFPTAQLGVLALVRLAEPVALTSIFPYSWPMTISFGIPERSAAFYAGILVAAFSAAEAVTGMFWGSLSDRVGRKPILLFGCVGTLTSLLIVGFAGNFWLALAGRILGGLLNGNIGVIQTMVGELVKNPAHEPKAFAVMPFIWSVGTMVGPAIGGYFAHPAKSFPSVFPSDSVFGRFPYLLPNLICAALLAVSIVAGFFLLEETNSAFLKDNEATLLGDGTNEPLLSRATDGQQDVYGTFHAEYAMSDESLDFYAKERTPSIPSFTYRKVFTKPIVMLIVALGLFTYHSMCFDHLLPIFLQDGRAPTLSLSGGLGLATQSVGIIMSVDGLLALFIQAFIFPPLVNFLGVWRTFVVVTTGHPFALFLVPYLTLLPQHLVYPGIFTCLALRNICSILAFPLLLILIKEAAMASSPSMLGTVNGLAASTGGLCRMIASPIAGLLFGFGADIGLDALAWWGACGIAIVGILQIPFIQPAADEPINVTDGWQAQGEMEAHTGENSVVDVFVSEANSSLKDPSLPVHDDPNSPDGRSRPGHRDE